MSELIERQSVIDLWEKYHHTIAVDAMQYDAELRQLPSAQPERHINEWCTDCKEYDKEKHCCPRWNRVIKNTVDELKSVQPELCEDAVSRTDALKFKCDCYDSEGHLLYAVPTGYILRLKPVTPKQRTGHWIPVGMVEAVGGESAQWGSAIAYHKCSECDEQALRDDFEQEVLSKWCPHCGAKMRGTLWE